MKNYSSLLQLEPFAEALIDGLKAELYLTPKPGLVDLANNGSHSDLSLNLMSRSIVLLRCYLQQLRVALAGPSQPAELIAIGQQAEQRMYRELGTNCHRGGIFLCGLLMVAAARADLHDPEALKRAIKKTAAEFFTIRNAKSSHGDQVRKQFPEAGIIDESLQGLPAMFEAVLPPVLDNGTDTCRGIYLAMAKLMQRVDDSTSLYRCGKEGLAHVCRAGKRLEICIAADEDPVPMLIEMDRKFRRLNLTMGGVADLLGIGLGYASYLLQSK